MAVGEAEQGLLQCALGAFDDAAESGQRDPDPRRLESCLQAKSLEQSTEGPGVAAHAADAKLLHMIKMEARDQAPDQGFVKRWKVSSKMASGSYVASGPSWVNPYVLPSEQSDIKGVQIHISDGGGETTLITARKSCPALVLPGYMKAGSTSFSNMLMEHPMVLSQLKGAHGFSEGELYYQANRTYRYGWTPLIEHDEPFVWFDVGLYYGEKKESEVLQIMQHDCVKPPNVLWLLREPISMMISTFRFMNGTGGGKEWRTLQEYVDFVRESPQNEANGGWFRVQRMDEMLEQPDRWKEHLPQGTVHAVALEEWGPDPVPHLQEAFGLMGLPEEAGNFTIKTRHDLSSNTTIDICRSSFDWLASRFEPKKKALMYAIGRKLKGWDPPEPPHGVSVKEKC